ncbi:MAG: hypothetical protein ACXW13_12485 [Burkholderiaceae bacterium]
MSQIKQLAANKTLMAAVAKGSDLNQTGGCRQSMRQLMSINKQRLCKDILTTNDVLPVAFAQALVVHAQPEELVLYLAAILVGELAAPGLKEQGEIRQRLCLCVSEREARRRVWALRY